MGGLRKFNDCYIPSSGPLNRSQKDSAKEAILWLLGRGAYSPPEISEHFGMDEVVVNELLYELVRSGHVTWVVDNHPLLRLRDPLEKWWEGG